MPVYTRVAGTWRLVPTPKAKVAGVWRDGVWWAKAAGFWSPCVAPDTVHTVTNGHLPASSPPDYTLDYYGWSDGTWYAAIGSVTLATFVDGTGTTRTLNSIVTWYFSDGVTSGSATELIMTGSVPNTDATFKRLVAGITLLRSGAAYDSPGGNSRWTWVNQNVLPVGGGGAVVRIRHY